MDNIGNFLQYMISLTYGKNVTFPFTRLKNSNTIVFHSSILKYVSSRMLIHARKTYVMDSWNIYSPIVFTSMHDLIPAASYSICLLKQSIYKHSRGRGMSMKVTKTQRMEMQAYYLACKTSSLIVYYQEDPLEALSSFYLPKQIRAWFGHLSENVSSRSQDWALVELIGRVNTSDIPDLEKYDPHKSRRPEWEISKIQNPDGTMPKMDLLTRTNLDVDEAGYFHEQAHNVSVYFVAVVILLVTLPLAFYLGKYSRYTAVPTA